ncbi:MAG TPA: SigB/SigF/SigG family RNA polymerase sigma factor [Solirubrobacteraceae bacterium]|jgi:RNA polymerase sigma-B factor
MAADPVECVPTERPYAGPSEAWLLARYHRQHDATAREELVRRMLPLVRRVATSYGARGHGDDLEQVAALGLFKAIERYDPTFGVPLRTYAIPTMFGEVRRYLRDHAWSVRVPRPLQERVLEATKAVERLSARAGRAPTPAEVAGEMGCDLEEALEALQAGAAYSAVSLDAPAGVVDDGERTLADTVGYDDERIELAEDVAALRALRDVLDDRDRRVLYLRFVEDLTQTEIAKRIGVSQMQVSRLIRKALQRLSERANGAAAQSG